MPIELIDSRGELVHVYNDSNYRELLSPPAGIVRHPHIGFGLRPPPPSFVSQLPRYRDSYPLIPRSEWPERIREMDRKRMWLKDKIRFPSFDQGSLGYCWVYCVAGAMTAIRCMQGHPYKRISACSIGGPIKNYRNEGGWPEEALNYAVEHGGVTEELWPNQSLDRNLYQQTLGQRHHKVVRAYRAERESIDEVATAAMNCHGCTTAHMWWMHAIQGGVRLVDLDGTDRWGNEIRNSWGESYGTKNRYGFGGFQVLEYPGKGKPDDVVVIVDVTASVR